MQIQTAIKNGFTILKRSFYTPPFKLADVTECKQEGVLRLMLMSSSPGVLDEDRYSINIDLEEGSSLDLRTQAYQRLFAMKKGATQQLEVHMGRRCRFAFLPFPVVPHEASIFSATNKIFLSAGCTLLWGEVLTCGRKLNGESFLFSSYQSDTEVVLCGRLVIKENLVMKPRQWDVDQMGLWEGFTHQASLIWLSENIDQKGRAEEVGDFLNAQPQIIFGISATAVSGLIIRILGHKAEPLHDLLKIISNKLSN